MSILEVNDIREIMTKNQSGFMFLDGCEYEVSRFTVYTCSNAEIETKVLGGYIAVSDYFILYALICLGHATAQVVYKYLSVMHINHPEMLIPESCDGINTRLKILSSFGVIRGFTYKPISNGIQGINIYCIADSGAKLVQRGLYKDCKYDSLCSTETISLVLRREACNYVGTILMCNSTCQEYMAKTDIHLGKGEKMQVYGRLYYKTGEGESERKYLAFVEPMFYTYDRRIMDNKENLLQISARILNYCKHLDYLKDKYTDTALIICVENWEGFIKSVQIIAQKAAELLPKCYFVSDRVLHLNGGDIKKAARCFISVSLTDNCGKTTISYKVAEHPVFFPLFDY